MTAPDPKPAPAKDPQAEAEFTRKMVLGLLSLLEQKGVLDKTEVDSVLRVARHATLPAPEKPRPLGPAPLGTAWVKPGQLHQPVDRNTKIAIPDVRLAHDPQGAGEEADRPAEDSAAPLPVIDMKME